jgi:hypothetical protein
MVVHLFVFVYLSVRVLTETSFTERIIEDHELVVEVLANWRMEEENKLYFRKNYAKYEFFKNPMVSVISMSSYRN